MSPGLALRLGQAADGCDARIQAATARAAADQTVETTRLKTVCDASQAAFDAELTRANEAAGRARALAEMAEPPWYARPWFVAPVTAIATAAVLVWVSRH